MKGQSLTYCAQLLHWISFQTICPYWAAPKHVAQYDEEDNQEDEELPMLLYLNIQQNHG